MTKLIQVLMTVGNQEEGNRIAEALVKNRLVACAQVSGPIKSTYWWQGKIETSQEWMCIAKSREDKLAGIIRQVKALHSYQVPEIIALPIVGIEENYGQWLEEELG